MNSFIESQSSPRRDSLNSLHRHSSGSFSSPSKPTTNTNNAQSTSVTTNTNSNIKDPLKDLEKFTRYFVIKTIQVIVQSRIRAYQRKRTESQPTGNDWFNLNIKDVPELSDRTKKVLDQDGFNIKSNWKFCCEISLKSQDGGHVILEHWIINHRSLLKNYLGSLREVNQIGGGQSSPKNSSSSIGGITQSGGLISPGSSGRIRCATLNSRTRLNSIDDDTFSTNNRTNGKTNDIKPSTSCYTLSSQSVNGATVADADNHHHVRSLVSDKQNIAFSNSNIKLASPNHHHNQTSANNGVTTSFSTSPSTKIKTLSTILSTMHLSTVYNRMTLLLKSILTTSHVVPAYQLASSIVGDESCEINYRIYMTNTQQQQQQQQPSPSSPIHCNSSRMGGSRGSVEDISNGRIGLNSSNRRSSISSNGGGGNSPNCSINIREFVNPLDLEHYCPILNLGGAKSELNELDVFLCYRTDIGNPFQFVRSSNHHIQSFSRGIYGGRIMDRDCITAAKQLLAGNEVKGSKGTDSGNKLNGLSSIDDASIDNKQSAADEPLRPAFATSADDNNVDNDTSREPSFDLLEPMFDSLLIIKDEHNCNQYESQNNNNHSKQIRNSNGTLKSDPDNSHNINNTSGRRSGNRSQPIEARANPLRKLISNEPLDCQTNGSTPKSLTDSFVFVELNPPFASDDQNDINSFFHGPSPVFKQANNCLKDPLEITNQLASIEADALQFDQFVDDICMSEFEDEENQDEDQDKDDHEEILQQQSGSSEADQNNLQPGGSDANER